MPAGRVAGEIARAALIVRVGVIVAVAPLESVILTVTAPLKTAAGVPLMAPEEEPIVNGLGSPVADQVYGGTPPDPVMVWL
jgi:hypothetical protein